ncbi:hypothetical protein BDV27DRAFT_4344 [Aspergillus caelatus]|uniref:DUF1308 domain-containing protein n=1 Tax=Aspergillus caelatus TaxID=61420 RepID=A0A5N7A3F1_9EURO|nr:uncharacterized protein BDV27DRAFT_4344 [Aspergillus caelatus]KAE8363699.1 hypothetical protein BDV27DRAFT_4344 [Aspergillus caelatus]
MTNDDCYSPTPENYEKAQALVLSLVERCRDLIGELDAFRALLKKTQRNPQLVEVRSLRSNVVSELRTLEKVSVQIRARADAAAADGEEEEEEEIEPRLMHALRSSNLPFYETVWNIARRSCTGLVAFGKRFYWDGEGVAEDEGKKRPNKDKRKSAFVDIVADDGEEWVKVSTISETRLLFEMAKKGWEADSDAESGEEERTVLRNFDDGGSDDEDEDEIELVKLASDMRKAANHTRVRYRHPRLRLVIPKIEEGESREIDDLLKVLRNYDIMVECGEGALSSRVGDNDDNVPSATAEGHLHHLLPTPFKSFTSTLNVDCTLLLALVSDVSHFKNIEPSPEYHKAIIRQLEFERERPLLATELWPAMEGHDLVCTDEATRRMREIVNTIGTDTEKRRTEILFGDTPFESQGTKSVIQGFQELSDYEIPPQLKMPVKTVKAKSLIDSAIEQGKLPPVFHKVAEILSNINHSVFFYGWVTGMTTISSNRTVVKQIETIIEQHRNGDEDLEGPQVWVCDTARSLIGKEKGRKS